MLRRSLLSALGSVAVGAAHASDLPTASASFARDRTALVFIEFQREWIGANGTLRRKLVKDDAGLERATVSAARVIEAARSRGWMIAHVALDLSSDPGYLVFGGGRRKLGLRAAIPTAQTWQANGTAFVAPFEPRPGEFVSQGRSGASALTNATLDAYLRNNRVDTIVLLGFATHVCIESTLRQGHDMGYDVHVVTDGVAAFEPDQQLHFERHILHHFGAGISATELIAAMGRSVG